MTEFGPKVSEYLEENTGKHTFNPRELAAIREVNSKIFKFVKDKLNGKSIYVHQALTEEEKKILKEQVILFEECDKIIDKAVLSPLWFHEFLRPLIIEDAYNTFKIVLK